MKVYLVTQSNRSFGYLGGWRAFDTWDKAMKHKLELEDLSDLPERYQKEFKENELVEIHTIEVE